MLTMYRANTDITVTPKQTQKVSVKCFLLLNAHLNLHSFLSLTRCCRQVTFAILLSRVNNFQFMAYYPMLKVNSTQSFPYPFSQLYQDQPYLKGFISVLNKSTYQKLFKLVQQKTTHNHTTYKSYNSFHWVQKDKQTTIQASQKNLQAK